MRAAAGTIFHGICEPLVSDSLSSAVWGLGFGEAWRREGGSTVGETERAGEDIVHPGGAGLEPEAVIAPGGRHDEVGKDGQPIPVAANSGQLSGLGARRRLEENIHIDPRYGIAGLIGYSHGRISADRRAGGSALRLADKGQHSGNAEAHDKLCSLRSGITGRGKIETVSSCLLNF